MSEPPRRPSSTEMTAVIPRDSLPPLSVVPGPTIEQLADVERARRDAMDAETLVACPWCAGEGMVSAEQRAEWLKAHTELGAGETS